MTLEVPQHIRQRLAAVIDDLKSAIRRITRCYRPTKKLKKLTHGAQYRRLRPPTLYLQEKAQPRRFTSRVGDQRNIAREGRRNIIR